MAEEKKSSSYTIIIIHMRICEAAHVPKPKITKFLVHFDL